MKFLPFIIALVKGLNEYTESLADCNAFAALF